MIVMKAMAQGLGTSWPVLASKVDHSFWVMRTIGLSSSLGNFLNNYAESIRQATRHYQQTIMAYRAVHIETMAASHSYMPTLPQMLCKSISQQRKRKHSP